jgi:hypothetical protein
VRPFFGVGKILMGLTLFVVTVTGPFWWSLIRRPAEPTPQKPLQALRCVEPPEYMRASHMELLNLWRDAVVRTGARFYVSQAYGTRHPMSLSDLSVQSCMSCHNNKAAFCDACHNYVGVGNPRCWNCHVDSNSGARTN